MEPAFKVEFLPEVDLSTFTPCQDMLMVRHIEAEELKTSGGVILGDKTAEEYRKTVMARGEVIAVGPEIKNKNIVKGATVYYYRQNSTSAVRVAIQAYYIFNEYHIMAVDVSAPIMVSEKTIENL